MISVTTWNVFARGEERKPVGNRSTTLIPTSWWNTGFIFAYHCKMGWQTILDEANEPTDFIRLKTLDPEMDWTTKILSTCLTISLGTLHVISRKPKIWQNLFREASPRFYEQITQANIGFVWPNWISMMPRRHLWWR